jgi:hypothetical protein
LRAVAWSTVTSEGSAPAIQRAAVPFDQQLDGAAGTKPNFQQVVSRNETDRFDLQVDVQLGLRVARTLLTRA